jgi:Ser/Thr protein kinase RdoA (MazF antagonist)
MPNPPVEPADTEVLAETVVSAGLADGYGLASAELRFLGGELDRNYRVSTDDGRTFLAKLRTKADRSDRLRWQKEILLHLADRHLGCAVPTLVPTIDGDLDLGFDVGSERWLLTVLNWVPGTDMVHVDNHSDGLLIDIGATAARVTIAIDGFRSESMHETHHWDVTRSADVIDECLALDPTLADNPDVLKALGWFTDVAPLLDSLPTAMVHNDLNDNNILVEEVDGVQKVAGVLDFNDALYTVRVAEPAIAGAYAMLRKDDPLATMGLIIAGYHGVMPLTDGELVVAYPLAAARLCVQALTWAVRGQTDPTEYGAMRMRHTLPALHRVLQVDPQSATAHLREACRLPPARRNGS